MKKILLITAVAINVFAKCDQHTNHNWNCYGVQINLSLTNIKNSLYWRGRKTIQFIFYCNQCHLMKQNVNANWYSIWGLYLGSNPVLCLGWSETSCTFTVKVGSNQPILPGFQSPHSVEVFMPSCTAGWTARVHVQHWHTSVALIMQNLTIASHF